MATAARLRRSSQMRFMFIVKSAHNAPPTPELLEAMHKLANREIAAGRMLDNGGLMPAATGAEVRIKEGKQRRRRRLCGGQGSDRRLRDLRAPGQGGGVGLGEGVHAAPQGLEAGLGRD